MREEFREIVDEIIKYKSQSNYKFRNFETEHFIYWIDSEYLYDNNDVTRDEFNMIRQYVVNKGTLPCIERRKKSKGEYSNPMIFSHSGSREMVLRYSKTYDSLECYDYIVELRAPKYRESDRIFVMKKKSMIFSINSKGFVRFGKRWMSLKNWDAILTTRYVNESIAKKLMNLMVGKDWTQDLKIQFYNIQNKNARKASSLMEAIELECGAKPMKTLVKALGEDYDSIITLYQLVGVNHMHKITNFLKNNKDQMSRIIKESPPGQKAYMILFAYFAVRDNRCEQQLLKDYFLMLIDAGKKLNLDVSSYSTLKTRHDETSRASLMKASNKKGGSLRIKSVYPNIKSFEGLDVEKIRSINRLNRESEVLHHCVHSYKDKINRGECAIYSLFYEGSSYTMELNAVKRDPINNDFNKAMGIVDTPSDVDEYDIKINQLKGKFNSDPPADMMRILDKMCKENNIVPVEHSTLSFKSSKKVKVKQLGEDILPRIGYYRTYKPEYVKGFEPEVMAVANNDEDLPF